MKEYCTLTEIMEMALSTAKPIKVKSRNGSLELFDPRINIKDGCYGINNDVISFVNNHTLFIIPYFRSVIKTLVDNGFVKKTIYVPFSNGDSPVDFQQKWNNLVADSRLQRHLDLISDCEELSNQLGYSAISNNLLDKCFEIPISGVKVAHKSGHKTYYPVITYENFNHKNADILGHYNIKNGVCVFIYRNGKTYVTRNSTVINSLRKNGYKKSNLIVPFTPSETICDSFYAHKWEVISV